MTSTLTKIQNYVQDYFSIEKGPDRFLNLQEFVKEKNRGDMLACLPKLKDDILEKMDKYNYININCTITNINVGYLREELYYDFPNICLLFNGEYIYKGHDFNILSNNPRDRYYYVKDDGGYICHNQLDISDISGTNILYPKRIYNF